MGGRRVLLLVQCLLIALALLFAATAGAFAAPSQSEYRAGGAPAPAPPLYRADGNSCPRHMPGGRGGGGGRDIIGAPGNAAVLLKLNNQGEEVRGAYFSPDGSLIATQSENALRLWDSRRGRILKVLPDARGFWAATFSPDGKKLAAVVGGDSVEILNVATGRQERSITVPRAVGVPGDDTASVAGLAYNPDGRLIAAARGTVAYVWDAGTGRELLRLMPKQIGEESYEAGHAGPIYSLQFTPNRQALVTAGDDGSIRMWDLASGVHLRCYGEDERDAFYSLAVSPDGRRIVALSWGKLSLWDAFSGALLRKMDGLGDHGFLSVTFSPDSRLLLTGGSDLTARIWDAGSGALTGVMRHPSWVMSAVFSGDGRRVVTRLDAEAWVWDAKHRNVALAAQSENLVDLGVQLAAVGDLRGAETKFRQAKSQNPDPSIPIPGAHGLNALCWFGALFGYGGEVLPHCEQAVSLEPDDAEIRDSRGVARALVGDLAGALDDFTFVVQRWRQSPPTRPEWLIERERWIMSMQVGTNPFDAATLEALRNE